MRILALLMALALCGPSCKGIDRAAENSPAAVAAWLKKTPDAQVLDVRTTEEYAGGHLAKAKLIPWTDGDFSARAKKELDSAKPILVYCRSGRRSALAAAELTKLGFARIRNLDGGINAWIKAGNPVIKSK